jgi:RecA-family ATPase/5S rRNA maturation endonuclease (ribonuclease M5)
MLSLNEIASALGGHVSAGQVLAPGPGHSAADRSLSIKLNDTGDDIVVHSFAGDDPIAAKDHIREKLGLPAWSAGRSNGNGRPVMLSIGQIAGILKPPESTGAKAEPPKRGRLTERYEYVDRAGKLVYVVERFEEPKGFRQCRPDGRGGWLYQGVFDGIARVPFRWPELAADMAAYPDAPIFLTEGEKDCDNVRNLGLTATTCAGSIWPDEVASLFAGRDVIVLEDNDQKGRQVSADVASLMHKAGARVRVARFTDLPEKGDVSDWIELGARKHNAEALIERVRGLPLWEGTEAPQEQHVDKADKPKDSTDEKPQAAKLPPLPWLNMAASDHEPRPEREWAIPDRVPLKQAGLFSGEGGTGKSIIELMKNVAHVLGKDWLGSMPEIGPAIYIGAEDHEKELHIRLLDIASHHGVTFADLIKGGLHVLPLLGQDATLCAVNPRTGRVETTELYQRLYEAAGDIKPKNISIDTLSRAFAGSEIDRVQVYAFCMHMQALAEVAEGSVTVLSHPSLQGINSGSGISGSTAWHGAFRFRQYLKGIKSEDAEQPDNDLRELQFLKNQYGPRGETVVLRYQRGLFLPEGGTSNLDKLAREAKADELFLELLRRFAGQGRFASHSQTSRNYAPTVFARESDAKKVHVKRADFEAAMSRLFNSNRIYVETYGRPSRPYTRLAEKP